MPQPLSIKANSFTHVLEPIPTFPLGHLIHQLVATLLFPHQTFPIWLGPSSA